MTSFLIWRWRHHRLPSKTTEGFSARQKLTTIHWHKKLLRGFNIIKKSYHLVRSKEWGEGDSNKNITDCCLAGFTQQLYHSCWCPKDFLPKFRLVEWLARSNFHLIGFESSLDDIVTWSRKAIRIQALVSNDYECLLESCYIVDF